jgi:hypothetical protein
VEGCVIGDDSVAPKKGFLNAVENGGNCSRGGCGCFICVRRGINCIKQLAKPVINH